MEHTTASMWDGIQSQQIYVYINSRIPWYRWPVDLPNEVWKHLPDVSRNTRRFPVRCPQIRPQFERPLLSWPSLIARRAREQHQGRKQTRLTYNGKAGPTYYHLPRDTWNSMLKNRHRRWCLRREVGAPPLLMHIVGVNKSIRVCGDIKRCTSKYIAQLCLGVYPIQSGSTLRGVCLVKYWTSSQQQWFWENPTYVLRGVGNFFPIRYAIGCVIQHCWGPSHLPPILCVPPGGFCHGFWGECRRY